jgi:carboxylesterase type B
MLFTNTFALAVIAGLIPSPRFVSAAASPVVTVVNGTYVGLHSDSYNQDIFLGMPYAQPPVGELRLRRPQSLNQSWNVPRQAVSYGDSCPAYVHILSFINF